MRRTLALAVLLALLAGCSPGAELQPEAAGDKPAPGPARTEPADGAAATVTVKDAPELSGRFWDGDLICLPPACTVTVTVLGLREFAIAEPARERDPDAWAKAGGAARKTELGAIDLFTPQLPDRLYSLSVRTAPGAIPLRFGIMLLHEADVTRNARTGEWRVTVGGAVIGTYPDPDSCESWRVRMHADLYRPPRYWSRITPQTEGLRLAPHVRVGQMVGFITDRDKTKPKRRHTEWFPPSRPLVYKLEMLTNELLASGLKFRGLAVNSAFRTPYYNRRVGGSAFSRHIYGDAVDVMIDEDGDEVCDELSGDARRDERDGLVLGQAARKVESAGAVALGGLGVYGFDGDESCRSYLHLDSRGYLTRWGMAYRGRSRRLFQWWPADEYREDEEPPPEFRDLRKPSGRPGDGVGE